MEDCSTKCVDHHPTFLNPWLLNFQKLGLELKCPRCLKFFSRPILLPCNHIVCNSCISSSKCPLCKSQVVDRVKRPVPFVENMVAIYKTLDATFSCMIQLVSSDVGGALERCSSLLNIGFGGSLVKDLSKSGQVGNSCGGQSEMISESEGNGSLRKLDELRLIRTEMNQAEQLSADGLLCGDSKDSEFCGSKYYDHRSENYVEKRFATRNSDDMTKVLRHAESSSESEGHYSDVKREKTSHPRHLELGVNGKNHTQPVIESEIKKSSNSELKQPSEFPSTSVQLHKASDYALEKKTICAFCQSYTISEVTGPMLHFSNGELALEEKESLSNVIHVHQMCVEWAPQIYYVEEIIQNLEAEVARSAKLKCSRCGLKGAALGCYIKSCKRSYHYTCAVEMSNCRWDYENYLVLCPSHSRKKFPNEKSLTDKKAVSIGSPSTQMCKTHNSSSAAVSQNETNKLVFCGSALSSEKQNLLVKAQKICGATVTKFWKPDVTHVIAATDENGAYSRTFKVLMAILNGRWVLKMDWIEACVEAYQVVNEEPYEVSLDNYGCSNGPKTGRLRAVSEAPKLFSGLSFYFSGHDFPPEYKKDLKELIVTGGGSVAERKEELAVSNHKESPRALVVYNLESRVGCMVGEEVLRQRLNQAEAVAAQIGARVVGSTWLVESIATCKWQDLVS